MEPRFVIRTRARLAFLVVLLASLGCSEDPIVIENSSSSGGGTTGTPRVAACDEDFRAQECTDCRDRSSRSCSVSCSQSYRYLEACAADAGCEMTDRLDDACLWQRCGGDYVGHIACIGRCFSFRACGGIDAGVCNTDDEAGCNACYWGDYLPCVNGTCSSLYSVWGECVSARGCVAQSGGVDPACERRLCGPETTALNACQLERCPAIAECFEETGGAGGAGGSSGAGGAGGAGGSSGAGGAGGAGGAAGSGGSGG